MATLEQSLVLFRKKGIRNMKYVAGMAIKDVMEGAQTPQTSAKFTGGSFQVGKIPVLDNILRESLWSGKNNAGWIRGSTSYLTVTTGLQLGDVISFVWSSPYSMRIEKGFRGVDRLGRHFNQAGRFYLATNMAKFHSYLQARAAEVINK